MVLNMPGKPQCLLLVGEEQIRNRLVQRLLELTPQRSEQRREPNEVLRIENKYYVADVVLITCTFDALQERLGGLYREYTLEGIVLVAARGSQSVEKSLVELHYIEEGLDIRLLAVDSPARVPADVSQRQHGAWSDAWEVKVRAACVEHCVEYCEVCTVDPVRDEVLYAQGESEGTRRVLDAFAAHIWPQMHSAKSIRVGVTQASPIAEPTGAELGLTTDGPRRVSTDSQIEAGEAMMEELHGARFLQPVHWHPSTFASAGYSLFHIRHCNRLGITRGHLSWSWEGNYMHRTHTSVARCNTIIKWYVSAGGRSTPALERNSEGRRCCSATSF